MDLDEDIGYEYEEVDENSADESFRRCLKQGEIFLKALESRLISIVQDDAESSVSDNILDAFISLRKYINSANFNGQLLSIHSLSDSFGLLLELLPQVRVITIQIDTQSPIGIRTFSILVEYKDFLVTIE